MNIWDILTSAVIATYLALSLVIKARSFASIANKNVGLFNWLMVPFLVGAVLSAGYAALVYLGWATVWGLGLIVLAFIDVLTAFRSSAQPYPTLLKLAFGLFTIYKLVVH